SMSSVDAPEISNLPSRGEIYTAEPAYLRLHGRNKDAWFEGGREARYTYRYNKDELSEWLRKMKKLLVKSGDIYIAFNNHPFGYSAMNATEFLEMLREIMPDSVPKRKLSLKSDSDQPTLF
ncbi:MAG TPA: DUF72 domain-containing protein, partial [Firmicutes bacterium]|nr:DUF72 domain-containing protein [Bacillota bacterium]